MSNFFAVYAVTCYKDLTSANKDIMSSATTACISTWIKKKKSCPTCCTKLSVADLGHNRVLENLLGKIEVRCAQKAVDSVCDDPPAKRKKGNEGSSRALGACNCSEAYRH